MVRTVPPAVLPIEGLTSKISTGKKREMRINSIASKYQKAEMLLSGVMSALEYLSVVSKPLAQ